MRVTEKNVVLSHGPDRAPLCGFVTYIHRGKPVLLRRTGWEVSNDIHDDFSDSVSKDNGKTWGTPRRSMGSTPVEGGVLVHTENAALYLPDTNTLIHWTNDKIESALKAGHDPNFSYKIRITAGEPDAVSQGTASDVQIVDFGLPQGPVLSFSTPLHDSHGRILVPVQWQMEDKAGVVRKRGFPARKDLPNVLQDVWEVGLMVGEQTSGRWNWRLGESVPYDFDLTSRGLCEPAIAELADGRFFMIIRGSNMAWPEKPGYKWLTFSEDGGETWSPVVPLPADDGSLIESSATGSALFRSQLDNRLYWIGNLCLEGRRPNGNMPRSPLYIAEMKENPVAIRRETVTVIDRARPGEHADTQHSNFEFYQDRVTGDVVVYLTRYGERGYDGGIWIQADLYQYRVAMR